MADELQIVPPVKSEIALASGVEAWMQAIRPEWKERRLIQRVQNLLPTDPSSACQRILNAAIHDLRHKIAVAGLDIAQEAAIRFRLPSVHKPEDILDTYSVSHIIDLAYRMGLLSRPEWRRIARCYEIRRDLEHEDDEYEATVEDCIYVFKTCVEVVLSQDPIELIKVSDIQAAIDSPDRFTPSVEMVENYRKAPHPRQLQIIELLVHTALDSKKSDIVRQNAMEVLRNYNSLTMAQVKIETAEMLQQRISKKPLDLMTVKVTYAAGVLPYLKQKQVAEFFAGFLVRFESVGHGWTQHDKHGKLFDDFEDVGALRHCPDVYLEHLLLWMTLCYLGEPGGYGMGRNRPVFYSNEAVRRIEAILRDGGERLLPAFEAACKDSRITSACRNKHIGRRHEALLEILIEKEKPQGTSGAIASAPTPVVPIQV